jgi:hypothetical protein
MAFAPAGWPEEKFVAGFIEINSDGGCRLNGETIQCDRVPLRLRAMHLMPNLPVLFLVDDAPYESVVMMLDLLKSIGFNDVLPSAPFLGTNPSKSVNHWIKFLVDGVRNQPPPIAPIATERFRTWGDYLIVLPASEFAIVDRLATVRTERGDCLSSIREVPKNLYESERRLILIEHADDVTRLCLIPRAAASCEFLTGVITLTNVAWGTGDLEMIRTVARGIGCNIGN